METEDSLPRLQRNTQAWEHEYGKRRQWPKFTTGGWLQIFGICTNSLQALRLSNCSAAWPPGHASHSCLLFINNNIFNSTRINESIIIIIFNKVGEELSDFCWSKVPVLSAVTHRGALSSRVWSHVCVGSGCYMISHQCSGHDRRGPRPQLTMQIWRGGRIISGLKGRKYS